MVYIDSRRMPSTVCPSKACIRGHPTLNVAVHSSCRNPRSVYPRAWDYCGTHREWKAHARTCLCLGIRRQAAVQRASDDAQGAAAVERHLVHHEWLRPPARVGSGRTRQQRCPLLHLHITCGMGDPMTLRSCCAATQGDMPQKPVIRQTTPLTWHRRPIGA